LRPISGCCSGGKPIIFFSVLAFAEVDDEVIYPNPGFPIYESMINYVGAKAVPIRLREELDFRLDVDELSGLINDRTKLIILNSPQNPTGGVLTEDDIAAIAPASASVLAGYTARSALSGGEGSSAEAVVDSRRAI
jgi:aspartate/methionine/tyrosine aminotransferase